ncbi:MAG: PDR/VanB family oxidoreductase [Pseudonocardiaceae bacterium]
MDTYLSPPPDLRGRQRPDRLFRALGALVTGYESLTSSSYRRRPATQHVDRDLNLVVDEVRLEAPDVRSFRLVAAGGAELPAWQPGCHLDVLLPSGRRRQYSLCGDPADRDSYRIAVRRIANGSGGSRELHDSVRTGRTLTVRGPRNAFPYVAAAGYLFIAGGIGITPILPMVKQAAADGVQWQLVYTGRSRESMPFLDELAALDPSRIRIRPYDQYGFPSSGAGLLMYAPAGATVYCCAPAPLIAGVRRDLPASAAETLHFERFSAPPILDGKPFEVALKRSDRVLTVPADRSALDVIREAVPDIAYSCQQGFCGTCRTRVISGDIDHRDGVLTDRERTDTMTICVSRGRGGRIALDL